MTAWAHGWYGYAPHMGLEVWGWLWRCLWLGFWCSGWTWWPAPLLAGKGRTGPWRS